MRIPIYRLGEVVGHAQVDDADAELVSGLWKLLGTSRKTRYAVRYNGERRAAGLSHTEYLHRVVMGEPPFAGAVVDHINGDSFDCRRANLRWVTLAQNAQNRVVNRDSKTGVRGVLRRGKRFRAVVQAAGGKVLWARHFATLDEAAVEVAAARREFLIYSV
jgi:HNH endonuclease